MSSPYARIIRRSQARQRARYVSRAETLRRFALSKPSLLDAPDDFSEEQLADAVVRWFQLDRGQVASLFRHKGERESTKISISFGAAFKKADQLGWLDISASFLQDAGVNLSPTDGQDCYECIKPLHVDAEFSATQVITFARAVARALQSDSDEIVTGKWRKATLLEKTRAALVTCRPKGLQPPDWVTQLQL